MALKGGLGAGIGRWREPCVHRQESKTFLQSVAPSLACGLPLAHPVAPGSRKVTGTEWTLSKCLLNEYMKE